MQITVGLDLDGPVWLGGLSPGTAELGALAVGPAGLARLLALHLGLPAPSPLLTRAATLVGPLKATEGFWSASAAADPLGTAEALLRWRDSLVWAGWLGEPASSRLQSLWNITSAVPFGPADIARVATEALSRRQPRWSVVALETEAEGLLRLLLDSLGATYRQGTADQRAPDEILVVEPSSIVDGADLAAAWLSNASTRVVVGDEPQIDEALARVGLPTLGLAGDPSDNPTLAVLPAVVTLAFDPDHPLLAQRLLRLPRSPISARYRRRLLAALSEWPSTKSPAWAAALDDAEAHMEPDERTRARKLLDATFGTSASLPERISLVETWAAAEKAVSSDESHWLRVLNQCRNARRLLALAGELRPLDVLRLVDGATEDVATPSRYAAQAGVAHVSHPGCVLGAAERVMWWATNDPIPTTPRLTKLERTALAAANVIMSDAATLARHRSVAWRRALSSATRGFLVVAPRFDPHGDPVARPPVIDEILSVADVPRARLLLEAARGERAQPRSLPQPRAAWTAPVGRLRLREAESPNSLATLTGCSLRWALRYSTALSAAPDGTLAGGPLLFGRLAHELLYAVLAENRAPGADALVRLMELRFDAEAPKLAATLFLPGMDAERAAVRGVIVDAARVVGRLMEDLSLSVQNAEVMLSSHPDWLGTRFQGKPDLVLGPTPTLILDFKWSLGSHKLALHAGTAHQLASYQFLVGGAGVDVGYLVLRLREVFSTSRLRARHVRHVDGPAPQVTWAAFARSASASATRLHDGVLMAPGADGVDIVDRLEGEDLVIAPPCSFCEHGVLCGRAVQGRR